MVLQNNGEFFKRYRIRTGKEDYMTPLGDFTIETKVKFPKWTNPEDGKFHPAGDPTNELGTRWMAFQGSIGIHGTIHPDTVGKYASNGCVGMLTQDVEELYDLVPIGTPIKIIGKMTKGGQTVQQQQ
jgi:lipoprotein-anchoring transpeptidase ErfK/SrfK